MSDARMLRYARQDGISQWWKEILGWARFEAEAKQWRRVYWIACELRARHECGEVECGETGICTRCWTLANVLRLLYGSYWRYSWDDPMDAVGYSYGGPPGEAVTARPKEEVEA